MDASDIKNGLLILHGFNAGLHVWNRQLVCRYGTGDDLSELALSKADATSLLRHIVIMGGDGSTTTQAFRWLDSLQIGLTMIENNGRVLLSWGRSSYPYATLARRQALAVYRETGLQVARWLMTEKLRGQAENLDTLRISSEPIRKEMRALVQAGSTEEMMLHESRAAAHYWGRLEGLQLVLARKNKGRVPSHWLSLGQRISPLSRRAMHAATPGQAMLNYLYGVAESVCAIQLACVGLNPDVGIIHTDVDGRRSMALDLIETVRPDIDKLAFTYFRQQVFAKSDFWETERGSVRLGMEVRKALVHNAFLVENRAFECAVKLRDQLSDYKTRMPKRRSIRMGGLELVHRCRYCGMPLARRKPGDLARAYCDDCLRIQKQEKLSRGNARGFRWTEAALAKHSETSSARQLEKAQWEAQFSERELQDVLQRERQRFVQEILPDLRSLTVTQIAKAVGISPRYASLIKQGRNIPHPCLYPKFEGCCSISGSEPARLLGRKGPKEAL